MKTALPTRRLIPRWRSVASTLALEEAVTTSRVGRSSPIRENAADLERAIEQWRATPTPGMLGEVLAFSVAPALLEKVLEVGCEAIAARLPTTQSQVELIHELRKSLPDAREIDALSADDGDAVHPYQDRIRKLRSLLRVSPDDSFALLDYAQLQAAIGRNNVADRALKTAMATAPASRAVLRTYARFLVHAGRPDEAHRLLLRHPRTPSDPWLMASEIALADAAGRSPEYLSKGKRLLLEKGSWFPEHATELAGVVAMAELSSGNLKKAREAQRKALLAPNDNVAAQAVDLENSFGVSLDGPRVARAISGASEALLLQAWAAGNPTEVEVNALRWHSEEPFSSRPIQMLTALYAFRGQFDSASRWAKAGLLTDPTDRGLLINFAYTAARWGKLEEADSALRRLRHLHHSSSEPFARATEGLMAYQRNDFALGDRFYAEAVQAFERARQPEVAAYCRVNQALSALDCRHPSLEQIVAAANHAFQQHPSRDALMLLRTRTIDGIAADSEARASNRRLSQWIYDSQSNSLVESAGVTSPGAPPILLRKLPS